MRRISPLPTRSSTRLEKEGKRRIWELLICVEWCSGGKRRVKMLIETHINTGEKSIASKIALDEN
jgi:hypothetical protein